MSGEYTSISTLCQGRSARTAAVTACLLFAFLQPANLHGSGIGPLGEANGYNVFVFGSFSETGADTGGALAVGGNASFKGNYAITQSLDGFAAPSESLDVDMSILSGIAEVDSGSAYIGKAGAGSAWLQGGSGPLPVGVGTSIDVAAQAASLIAYSNQLSRLPTSPGASESGGVFTDAIGGLDVFDVPAADLGVGAIKIEVPTSATVLINVIGASVTTLNDGFTSTQPSRTTGTVQPRPRTYCSISIRRATSYLAAPSRGRFSHRRRV